MSHIPAHRSTTLPVSIMSLSSSSSGGPSRQLSDPRNTDGYPSTGRSGGNRTPRRVQWASKDDVRLSVDPGTSTGTGLHALDEMGLDPNAFETLRGALERHKSLSTSSSGKAIREADLSRSQLQPVSLTQPLPPRPAQTTTSSSQPEVSNRNSVSRQPQRSYSSSTDDTSHHSGSSTTGSSTTGTNTPFPDSPLLIQHTYDIPGEAWIDPHEKEGLPAGPTLLGTSLGMGVFDPNQSASGTIANGVPRSNSLFRSQRRRVSTPSDPTAFNSVAENHVERLAVHRAASVVRTHTRRGVRWLHRPYSGGRGHEGERGGVSRDKDENKTAKCRREFLDNSEQSARARAESGQINAKQKSEGEIHDHDGLHTKTKVKAGPRSWLRSLVNRNPATTPLDRHDPESHAPQSHPRIATSVLSALLTLYGHDHDEGSVSGESRRSRISSAAESEAGDESCGDKEGKFKLETPVRPWVESPAGKDSVKTLKLDSQPRSTAPCSSQCTTAYSKPSQPQQSLGRSLKTSSASSLLHALQLRTHALPTSATTAALIAGAGMLGGAAAPSGATLAPDLRRGEGLVRYEVVNDGKAEKTDSPDTMVPTPSSTESHQTVSDPTTGTSPCSSSSPKNSADTTRRGVKRGWKAILRDIPLPTSISRTSLSIPGASDGWKRLSRSMPSTPTGGLGGLGWVPSSGITTMGTSSGGTTARATSELGTPPNAMDEREREDYFGEVLWDIEEREKEKERLREKERRKWERREKKEREKEKRRKRKKVEVWITRHVAAILQRQEFILKFARAMMMFGGPSHRLVAQIQSTGRVLDLELSCMYLPDVMLISFEDSATGTSNVKFIRQGSALDLEKLGEAHALYWNVIHDAMSVSQASAALDVLMRKKPLYNFIQLVLIGGMCSASICSVAFSGSFIDSLVSAPLGGLLVAVQLLSPRNELYGNVFEITIATLMSFVSATLASTDHFCYSAVASSSVVLILPGYIVLCGSLEIASRSLVAGAVRLCFALMYSLFLGFGLSIGAELYAKLVGNTVIGLTDYTCSNSHDTSGPWWQQTPSLWWAFLTVPLFSLFLSMRLMAPWWKRELPWLVAISCIGWVTNHFVGLKFPNQSDISAAVGAFAVGFVSNVYGRFFNGSTFVVMITGILFQVPSGLGNGGLFNFVSDQTSGSSVSYLSGFQTALQLISVAIGLTVGLGISLVVVHPVQSRRRAGGLFSL